MTQDCTWRSFSAIRFFTAHSLWRLAAVGCLAPLVTLQGSAQAEPTASHATVPSTTLRAIALPWQEAELRAEVSQTIAQIFVHEGEVVKRGQLLLEFDRRASLQHRKVAEATERGAKAAWLKAKLELRLADYRHQQLQGAYAAGASTSGEMQESSVRRDQAEAAVDAAQHALDEAAARRKLAEVEDQRRQLTAPFGGVVLRVNAELGETSDASQPLLVLADLSQLRVEWPMPIQQAKNARLGSVWQLAAGVPVEANLSATLVTVEPRMNPVTQTVRAVFQINNDHSFPSGFSIQRISPSALEAKVD